MSWNKQNESHKMRRHAQKTLWNRRDFKLFSKIQKLYELSAFMTVLNIVKRIEGSLRLANGECNTPEFDEKVRLLKWPYTHRCCKFHDKYSDSGDQADKQISRREHQEGHGGHAEEPRKQVQQRGACQAGK